LAGAVFPLLYLLTLRRTVVIIALFALMITVGIEWGRQRLNVLERLFELLIGPALRQGEESKPTTGTWSMLGILVTVLVFKREFAIPAMLYAQVGDPAAEIVGRRWGRVRIPGGKSLEGSLGCLTVNLAVGLTCTQLLPLSPGLAAVGAVAATVAEAAPLSMGDNLLMAPLAGLAMTVAALVIS
jgi:dolichol kinase